MDEPDHRDTPEAPELPEAPEPPEAPEEERPQKTQKAQTGPAELVVAAAVRFEEAARRLRERGADRGDRPGALAAALALRKVVNAAIAELLK